MLLLSNQIKVLKMSVLIIYRLTYWNITKYTTQFSITCTCIRCCTLFSSWITFLITYWLNTVPSMHHNEHSD